MMTPDNARLRIWLPIAITVFAIWATWMRYPAALFVDEYDHYPQAMEFAHGGWKVSPDISTWPTMNAVVGWTAAAIGEADSLFTHRAVIAAFALLGIAGFVKLAGEFDPEAARMRMAQFFVSPVVLPFCALVYTDIPALACLLWGAYGALTRNAWLMLIGVAAATAFRQSNIVWLPALCALYAWLKHRNDEPLPRPAVAAGIAIVLAWGAVVWSRGGVAYGSWTQGAHPGHFKGVPNFWFGLLVAAIVFAPYFLARLWSGRKVKFGLIGFLILGLVIACTFEVTHQFNYVHVDYFIRNTMLVWIAKNGGLGIVVPIVAVMAVLVVRTKLAKDQWLLVPFLLVAALNLLPFWLIEQRYFIPIFGLFWAMRARAHPVVEWSQFVFGIGMSIWTVQLIASGQHFL